MRSGHVNKNLVQNETFAFLYRRHATSSISPFKLPYSYNLIWDSTGRNNNHKQIRIWSLNCPPGWVFRKAYEDSLHFKKTSKKFHFFIFWKNWPWTNFKDYVAVGHIVTESPDYPQQGDIYCVRRYFVEIGNLSSDEKEQNAWSSVWTTSKYKSNQNVQLFQQKSSSDLEHISPDSFQV